MSGSGSGLSWEIGSGSGFGLSWEVGSRSGSCQYQTGPATLTLQYCVFPKLTKLNITNNPSIRGGIQKIRLFTGHVLTHGLNLLWKPSNHLYYDLGVDGWLQCLCYTPLVLGYLVLDQQNLNIQKNVFYHFLCLLLKDTKLYLMIPNTNLAYPAGFGWHCPGQRCGLEPHHAGGQTAL